MDRIQIELDWGCASTKANSEQSTTTTIPSRANVGGRAIAASKAIATDTRSHPVRESLGGGFRVMPLGIVAGILFVYTIYI